MKKRKVSSLSLKKNTIASMDVKVLTGGAAGSGFLSCAPDPLPSQKQTCQYSCDVNKTCYCFFEQAGQDHVYVTSL